MQVYRAGGSPCNIVANVLDYNILVTEFEFQSRYYIQFWSNILGKGMNPFIPHYMLNSITIVLQLWLPSWLGQWNTLIAHLQRDNIPSNECPDYDTKQSDGVVQWSWGFGNAAHPFIAIAPRPTLVRNGSTW